MKIEKDRETTEKRLLTAVGEIVEESGLESLGINAVAQRAGVSKMLIYLSLIHISEPTRP